jgi:hypothetical protein
MYRLQKKKNLAVAEYWGFITDILPPLFLLFLEKYKVHNLTLLNKSIFFVGTYNCIQQLLGQY